MTTKEFLWRSYEYFFAIFSSPKQKRWCILTIPVHLPSKDSFACFRKKGDENASHKFRTCSHDGRENRHCWTATNQITTFGRYFDGVNLANGNLVIFHFPKYRTQISLWTVTDLSEHTNGSLPCFRQKRPQKVELLKNLLYRESKSVWQAPQPPHSRWSPGPPPPSTFYSRYSGSQNHCSKLESVLKYGSNKIEIEKLSEGQTFRIFKFKNPVPENF